MRRDPLLRAQARLGARSRTHLDPRGGEWPEGLARLVLGPRRKHSCCLWTDGVEDLAHAEEAMLALSGARAAVQDGMDVLELGSGWGALSLWVAEHHPGARVLAVTGSDEQREFVTAEAGRRGCDNLAIAAGTDVDAGRRFDRVLLIEPGPDGWADRVASSLAPGGRVLVQTAGRRSAAPGPGRDLVLERRWRMSGTHYARTARAWLRNLDADHAEALRVLGRRDPPSVARRMLETRRRALISTAETFASRRGREWLVSHDLLAPRG